ncbi:MAG: hypothetical protein HKN60_04000 [Rhizobiales bacterium]|nr:hypothetical protein [Hyphomicrobiales bacterium]
MRFVIAFFLVTGLWLVARDYMTGERKMGQVTDFLFSDRPDKDAPNWGDVAAKIGELADERTGLVQELDPPPETVQQK